MKYDMKPAFRQIMEDLLPNKEDFDNFEKIIHTQPRNFIRCNTIKITPEALLERLRKRWSVSQPFPNNPEILIIETNLGPGELGNAPEHILGYYYVQEISSMLSVIALDPKPGELVLDVAASPGSKTTQIAQFMQNQGTIIANDVKLDRIIILSSNLERCGASNVIVTKNDAVNLCSNIQHSEFRFDKILLDAPCSGEGTMRSSPKTFLMWNPKIITKFSRQQKKMFANAVKCLKVGGSIVYSTCTHSPEENEEIVDFALKNFPLKIEDIKIPLKSRPGLISWQDQKFNSETSKACRIYPQDNDSEGFFLAKFTLLEEITQ